MTPQPHSPVITCLLKLQLIAVVALLLAGSGQGAASAAPVNARVMTAEYFTIVLAELDFETITAIVAPNAAIHTPEGEFRGHEGASAFAGTLGAAFSDLTFTTGEPALEGNVVAVQWMMTGIHTGDYLDQQPNCSAVVVNGIAIFRFDDVQIVEQWIQYDRLALVRQMEAFAAIDASTRHGCA